MKKKYLQKYSSKDIASIINELIESIQTPDGNVFKASHVLEDTILIKVGPQTFIINISEKGKLS